MFMFRHLALAKWANEANEVILWFSGQKFRSKSCTIKYARNSCNIGIRPSLPVKVCEILRLFEIFWGGGPARTVTQAVPFATVRRARELRLRSARAMAAGGAAARGAGGADGLD